MNKQYCLLLLVACFYFYASAISVDNWFIQNMPTPCTGYGPRLRKSWSVLTPKERQNFINIALQMKQYDYDPIVNSGLTTKGQTNLWDIFATLHNKGQKWHDNVNFAYAHKSLLSLIESAMAYIAQVRGSVMDPPMTIQEACQFGLPYFEWEKYYGSEVFTADIWDPTLMGTTSTSKDSNYTVCDGRFTADVWKLVFPSNVNPATPDSCAGTNAVKCTNKLKRWFDPSNAPTVKVAEILNDIVTRCKSVDQIKWITNNVHNGMHLFVGFNMARASLSADDPIFWLHHCNVDRFLHLWGDCNGYDKVDTGYLTQDHYNATPSLGFSLDGKISYPSTTPWGLKSSTLWPSPRELWTMGTDTQRGWGGLYYRYAEDNLASSAMSIVCPDQDFNWVLKKAAITLGLKKKRSTLSAGEKNYAEADARFNDYTQNQGMSPADAIKIMAIEDCLSSPTNMSPYAVHYRHLLSHFPETRVCDGLNSKDLEFLKSKVTKK